MNANQTKELRRLNRKVKEAIATGSRRKSILAFRLYIRSTAAKQNAIDLAHKEQKQRRGGKPKFADLADKLDLYRPCNDPVTVIPKLRSSDPSSCRFILSFPFVHQVRQVLLREFLKLMWKPHDSQMLMAGNERRGVQKAISAVRRHYSDGYKNVAELDISRCYQSFGALGIAKLLGLPEKVVENVLCVASHTVIPSTNTMGGVACHMWSNHDDPMLCFEEQFGEDWTAAQQGLVEGSKVSPLVAEMLLAEVCKDVEECGDICVVNFADNFFLMARNARGLWNAKSTLQRSLHDHPAGPLLAKQLGAMSNGSGPIDFLGYKLTPYLLSLKAEPSDKNFKKMKRMRARAHKAMRAARNDQQRLEILRDIQNRHWSTLNAFGHWEDRLDFHRQKMRSLEDHVFRDERS